MPRYITRFAPWLVVFLITLTACAEKRIAPGQPPKPLEKKIDPITIEARPHNIISLVRTSINLTIVIEPHPENKWVEWSWSSAEGDIGSDGHSIDGRSQKKFRAQITLSPGSYEIIATLLRGKTTFTARTTVNIIDDDPRR